MLDEREKREDTEGKDVMEKRGEKMWQIKRMVQRNAMILGGYKEWQEE